MNISIFL